MSEKSIKAIINAASAIITATTVNAAEPDWKDAPELGNADGDHCITVSEKGIESDGSAIENYLVGIHEYAPPEEDYDKAKQQRLTALFGKGAITEICLGETPPSANGIFQNPNHILLNEDFFRYPYENGGGIPNPWALAETYNHEQEHQMSHILAEEAAIDMSDWSSSDFIQWRFAEEMLATYSGKLSTDEIASIEPHIIRTLNDWLTNNGDGLYPCLAHSANFPNGTHNIDAADFNAIIGSHLPGHEMLSTIFANGTAIRAKMQELADSYVAMHTDRIEAEQCYPPRPNGKYNLSNNGKDIAMDALYYPTLSYGSIASE